LPHYSFIILADIDVRIIYPLLENITNDIQVVTSYNECDSIFNFCIFLPLKVVLYVKQFRYWLLMLNSWRVAIRGRDKERQLTMVCAQPGLMSRSAIFHKERSNNNKTSVWLLAFMTQIVPLLVEYCVRNFCLWEIFLLMIIDHSYRHEVYWVQHCLFVCWFFVCTAQNAVFGETPFKGR